MSTIVWLSIIFVLLILMIISIYFFFIGRRKQEAVQIFTIESFIHAHHMNTDNPHKQGIVDKINDFFENTEEADSDSGEDSEDGGEDGGH
ncbi:MULTISPECIES: hypothetical protein [unclassified Sutcliffiella]|uniref:hypothetical protein n=1 Tax=unclassified Sutcliffiella TaxID=2837532 RepID=UPI0030CEE1F9